MEFFYFQKLSNLHERCIGFFLLWTCKPLPPPFKSGANFMKDAECAETNEKTIFRINDHNSKNNNWRNRKFDYSFDSAGSGSSM